MIYRVIFKVGYHERWFDFDNVTSAARFAETILRHDVTNEDHEKRETSVKMEIIKTEQEVADNGMEF